MGNIIYLESFLQPQFILSPAVGNEENICEIIKKIWWKWWRNRTRPSA